MVEEIAQLVTARNGHRPPIDNLSLDDPAVYNTLAEVDTIGVFQVEIPRPGADASPPASPLF